MQNMLHLMVIGNDSVLISHVLTKLQKENVSFEICKNIESANEKIALSMPDVYLFDHRKWMEVLDLVKDIRKKEKKISTIAVVVKNLEELDLLKNQSEKIDVILEESGNFDELDEFLQKIIPPKPSLKNKLASLKEHYDESIHTKIATLTGLIDQAKEDPEKVKDLRVEIHKMSGSAGTYGYSAVSHTCKVLESDIDQRLLNNTYSDPKWLSELITHLTKILQGFQQGTTPSYILEKQETVKPLVYITDDDTHFLDLIERVKDSFWIDLEIEKSPESALSRVKEQGFCPKALIVPEHFHASTITGFQIIKELEERNRENPPLCSILLDKDTVDKRLEVLEKGIKFTFSKPVSAYILLKTISDALNTKPVSFKALIVDDDVDFCSYTSLVLEEIGAIVSTLNEPSDLFEKLDALKPDLLILDIVMPKYDGINLLKTIRHDVAYRDLIIILVTGNDTLLTKISAYAEKVDDILFKPIDPKIMQKRISNLLNRRGPLNKTNNDYTTGLQSYQELMEELNASLNSAEVKTHHLVLFEVHRENSKEPSEKELTTFIGNQLHWEKDYRLKCFRVRENQYAMIFETRELDVIEKKLYEFLYRLVQDKIKWNISINAAIVPISRGFVNPRELMLVAEEVILEASAKEFAPVRISHRYPKGSHPIKRHVMIIDPDMNVQKILKQAFEAHDLFVSTYSEGGVALKDLFACTENTLPSLIIMERKLPDMEGMDLYIKLKNRFRTTIPFFMLTIFSSDKDVSDSIKYGVIEYIVKPFNISLLVQKGLQVVFNAVRR